MKIFITGGTGFIGSYVTMALLEKGHEITILARNRKKIPFFMDHPNLKLIEGDIQNCNTFEKHLQGEDTIIYLALNYSGKTGSEVLSNDTLPTVKMVDLAIKYGVKNFIYTSSTSVVDVLYSGVKIDLNKDFSSVIPDTYYHPSTLYGATKAATECYLLALSYQSQMRINIIRPGYTFGNPVVDSAPVEADSRFFSIVEKVLKNEDIKVIKNDGTQFIWAGHLAQLYVKLVESNFNRKIYYALSKHFVSWAEIAEEAIRICNSKSRLEIEDKGWKEKGIYWDVSEIEKDFGLSFEPWEKIKDHLIYCIGKSKEKIGLK
ncbi:MAG: NAD(P)-dependent oxidoreductase [Chitinispirillaceae bacterium]|nr:NAD(P)-dependent oxidoreductase [Chitinispirillaceae bacterium]